MECGRGPAARFDSDVGGGSERDSERLPGGGWVGVVSKTTYAALFGVIGDTYGAPGDFYVIDSSGATFYEIRPCQINELSIDQTA